MRNFLRLAAIALLSLSLSTRAASVKVFAAASLTDSLKDIAAAYEKTSTDKIIFNFAGSGVLARQIEEGAPADIFFSADTAKIDTLQQKGLLTHNRRVDLLGNLLVAVVPKLPAVGSNSAETQTITNAANLTASFVKRIAIGEPKIVPAGAYAKSYFESRNLWAQLKSKIIPCENVRAVLAAVESGNVDAGMVYQTDATISKQVKIAFEIPLADGPKITYSLAIVKDSKQTAAADKFLHWLKSASAAEIFRKAGFIVLAQPSPAP